MLPSVHPAFSRNCPAAIHFRGGLDRENIKRTFVAIVKVMTISRFKAGPRISQAAVHRIDRLPRPVSCIELTCRDSSVTNSSTVCRLFLVREVRGYGLARRRRVRQPTHDVHPCRRSAIRTAISVGE